MDKNIDIKIGNKNDLKEIFKFYQEDFIEEERKSLDHLEKLLDTPNYALLLAMDKGKLVGYSFLCKIPEMKKMWLDYIAIMKDARGSNYGSLLIEKMIEIHKDHFDGMFFEIEGPNPESSEYIMQQKRLKFYAQFDLEKLNLNYKIPTEDGGFPIDLYYKSFKEEKNAISMKEVRDTVEAVFEIIHFDVSIRKNIFDEIDFYRQVGA